MLPSRDAPFARRSSAMLSRSEAMAPVRGTGDLIAGGILALAGALAAAFLPDGDPARVAMATPVLLLVPGYLLIQTFVVRTPTGQPRAFHVLVALGLSPAVVALLALATTVIPNGFRPATIIWFVTVGCLLLATVARMRRYHAIAADVHESAATKGVVSHSRSTP